LEKLACDFALAVGIENALGISLHLRFSLKNGVEILNGIDDRIKKTFYDICFQSTGFVTEEHVKELGLLEKLKVKQGNSSQIEVVKKAIDQEIVAFEGLSLTLYQKGISSDVEIIMKMQSLQVRIKGDHQTTSALRYPHLYRDLLNRFNREKRDGAQLHIRIIEPGSFIGDSHLLYSSQFAEMLALFPNSHFTLNTCDSSSAERLRLQLKSLQRAPYDPLTLRTCASETYFELNYTNRKYRDVFQTIIDGINQLSGRTNSFMDDETPNPLLLKTQPKCINIASFDFPSIWNKLNARSDIIVAIMVLGDLLDACHGDSLAVLEGFILALNVGGTLYLDLPTGDRILDEGEERFERKNRLEKKIGCEIEIEKIPVSDYVLKADGDCALVHYLTLHESNKVKKDSCFLEILSTSLIAITRK